MAERRPRTVSIALPSSLVSEHNHLRDKTRTLGAIARAASIYRVEQIYLYIDQPDESHLMKEILTYIETPQYLRKRLFKKKPELAFAGLLPPLRTAHHTLVKRSKKIPIGTHREGVVLSEYSGEYLVDIGVEQPIHVYGRSPSIGSRVTVEVTDRNPLKGKFSGRKGVPEYWGYRVLTTRHKLEGLLQKYDFDLKIAASKNGVEYNSVVERLKESWLHASNILLAFGSPRKGLVDMLMKQNRALDKVFDYNINMIPRQGCATVRTEEALHASLAIFNLIDSD
jgi:predicted SPOUT superfamily RNA methylase MTH1